MKLRFLDRPPKKILSTQSALSGLTSEQLAAPNLAGRARFCSGFAPFAVVPIRGAAYDRFFGPRTGPRGKGWRAERLNSQERQPDDESNQSEPGGSLAFKYHDYPP